MKAISLWEPWATAMALGVKQNETRSWLTDYRGDLLICAAAKPVDDWGNELWHEYVKGLSDPQPLAPGCALAIVEVFDCVQSEYFAAPGVAPADGQRPLTILEAGLGDYTAGRWVWLTRNPRRLAWPPPSVKGRQRFFNVPDEIILPHLEGGTP